MQRSVYTFTLVANTTQNFIPTEDGNVVGVFGTVPVTKKLAVATFDTPAEVTLASVGANGWIFFYGADNGTADVAFSCEALRFPITKGQKVFVECSGTGHLGVIFEPKS
jgi:hypothetical protein